MLRIGCINSLGCCFLYGNNNFKDETLCRELIVALSLNRYEPVGKHVSSLVEFVDNTKDKISISVKDDYDIDGPRFFDLFVESYSKVV